jgi:hypothetical protein
MVESSQNAFKEWLSELIQRSFSQVHLPFFENELLQARSKSMPQEVDQLLHTLRDSPENAVLQVF